MMLGAARTRHAEHGAAVAHFRHWLCWLACVRIVVPQSPRREGAMVDAVCAPAAAQFRVERLGDVDPAASGY